MKPPTVVEVLTQNRHLVHPGYLDRQYRIHCNFHLQNIDNYIILLCMHVYSIMYMYKRKHQYLMQIPIANTDLCKDGNIMYKSFSNCEVLTLKMYA
jgi:hypothetical protein